MEQGTLERNVMMETIMIVMVETQAVKLNKTIIVLEEAQAQLMYDQHVRQDMWSIQIRMHESESK